MAKHSKRQDTAILEARIAELSAQLAIARLPCTSQVLPRIGHELRTPLNAILGFSQILASNSLPTSDEQKKKFAGHILKAGRHLLVLINQTVDLLKAEAYSATLAPVVLAEVLEKCATIIAPLAATRSIKMQFPVEADFHIVSDSTRLEAAILILLDNAVKYNVEPGSVTVSCTLDDAHRLRINVEDTGAGLDEVQMAGLFQPFNRLGQEAGEIEGGGIGLFLCQRLIESLGGELGASSLPGVGSRFTITLPATATT